MAKTCIICDERADSREHVFPASFGGRRTNNGIYCQKHNNEFGRHVSALLKGLDIVNALVGVIPDRHEEVRPAIVTAASGDRYLVSKDRAMLAPPPPLTETPELVGKEVTLAFADRAQAEEWGERQRAAGYKVDFVGVGPVQSRFFPEPMHAKRVIGDEDFMRAVLYLALTFLAHRFPALARSTYLAGAREAVERDLPTEHQVWWEPPELLNQLPPNPYTYGNTVAISVNAETGKVTALVSFYGEILFGVDLGTHTGESTVLVTTHIDPLAPKPPHDLQEFRADGRYLVLGSPESGKQYLTDLRNGVAPVFCETLSSASDTELAAASKTLLPEFLATKVLSPHERADAIFRLLSTQQQRILNLLRGGIEGFAKSTPELPTAVHEALRILVKPDPGASRGMSRECEIALHVATAAMTDAVRQHVDANTLDLDSLVGLLGGGPGVAITFGTVAKIFFRSWDR
ncbi:HNH endonuclease [Burkholderia cepacia]|uniref:HNH endonuclease n=1 Tax=Burkholderia cepacia TaxID=292 RepID=UPI002147B00A|nr:HNH endonuclease [Burkholderia cepacia]